MSKQQMSSADAAWLHMDRPTNLMVVNSVLWFDEQMDLERGREVVRERLVERYPRFRQRIVGPRAGVTPPQIERRLVDLFASKSTLVLTNVPGPWQPVYFAGTRVAGIIPWVPAGGSISLGLSIFSHNGEVTVGVRVDAGLVPNPDVILNEFTRELEQLALLTPGPNAKPRQRPTSNRGATRPRQRHALVDP